MRTRWDATIGGRNDVGRSFAINVLLAYVVALIGFVRPSSAADAQPQVVEAPPPAQQIDSEPIVAQATRRPVTGKPTKLPAPPSTQLQQPPASSTVPTVTELADLYARVGRELTNASKRDSTSTIDLWPRYRWIRFMDAVKTPAKREAAAVILRRLQTDLRALVKET